MVGPDSKPVSGEPVYVFAGDAQNITLTTDAKGTAAFSFDTALWRDTVVLKVGRRTANMPPPEPSDETLCPVSPGQVQEEGGARALPAQPAPARVPLG